MEGWIFTESSGSLAFVLWVLGVRGGGEFEYVVMVALRWWSKIFSVYNRLRLFCHIGKIYAAIGSTHDEFGKPVHDWKMLLSVVIKRQNSFWRAGVPVRRLCVVMNHYRGPRELFV